MVRHHVAQRAGRFVEARAGLDADGFRDRYLHMVDAVAVPDRLEQSVGEAQRHDVLHRLLAEEMIDAIDLVLAQRLQYLRVERDGRRVIVAERLFDDHAAPRLTLLLRQAGAAQPIDNGAEKPFRHRQVKQRATAQRLLAFDLSQFRAEPPVGLGFEEIAGEVGHHAGELGPGLLIDRGRVELIALLLYRALDEIVQALAPIVGRAVVVIDPDHHKAVRKQPHLQKIVERGNDEALGQIAAGAEDHKRAGRRRRRRRLGDVVAFARAHLSPPGSTWPPKP